MRERYAAMNTTIDQPMPISRRFAPVMLARASEHALSRVSFAALHASPNCSNAFPPFHASTMSTAYSGSTAMNARTAIASPAEMSSCATSAAHDRMKAAPTIASPNSSASTAFARDASEKRSTIAGIVRATAMSSEVRLRPAGASPSEMSDGRRLAIGTHGPSSRPKVSSSPGARDPPGRDARPS